MFFAQSAVDLLKLFFVVNAKATKKRCFAVLGKSEIDKRLFQNKMNFGIQPQTTVVFDVFCGWFSKKNPE